MFGGQPGMLIGAPVKGCVVDLVTAAKANPGNFRFGSVGIGSASYPASEGSGQLADWISRPSPTLSQRKRSPTLPPGESTFISCR
jgi:hypothetical protein